MRILLTGGCGFIGSAVVRHLVRATDHTVLNVDSMTYAASEDALEEARTHERHTHLRADITDAAAIGRAFAEFRPDAVMHLAAESHVDRSIDGPGQCSSQTNVVGTFTLLEATRKYWGGLPSRGSSDAFRFHHISTDEVYGHAGPHEGLFTEADRHTTPNSPYSASKAGSDHLVRAWQRDLRVCRCFDHQHDSNNYGPYHFPEKLIPLCHDQSAGLAGEPLPIYGKGDEYPRLALSSKTMPEALRASGRKAVCRETVYNDRCP